MAAKSSICIVVTLYSRHFALLDNNIRFKHHHFQTAAYGSYISSFVLMSASISLKLPNLTVSIFLVNTRDCRGRPYLLQVVQSSCPVSLVIRCRSRLQIFMLPAVFFCFMVPLQLTFLICLIVNSCSTFYL